MPRLRTEPLTRASGFGSDAYRIFKILDFNGNDELDDHDLSVLFSKLSVPASEAEIQQAIRMICGDPAGQLSFPVYHRWIKGLLEEGLLGKHLAPVFDLLDHNGDGVVTGDELVSTVTCLGQKLAVEEATALMGESLDFEQFVRLVQSHMKEG